MNVITDAEERKIQRKAIISPIQKIAAYLQKSLGQKMTAYISGLNDHKVVSSWISGAGNPTQIKALRLRCAYNIVRMFVDVYDTDTAKAWLFGSNTKLEDQAPAYILRYSTEPDVQTNLVKIARSFINSTE